MSQSMTLASSSMIAGVDSCSCSAAVVLGGSIALLSCRSIWQKLQHKFWLSDRSANVQLICYMQTVKKEKLQDLYLCRHILVPHCWYLLRVWAAPLAIINCQQLNRPPSTVVRKMGIRASRKAHGHLKYNHMLKNVNTCYRHLHAITRYCCKPCCTTSTSNIFIDCPPEC